MKLSLLLVLSAVADGTLFTQFLTALLKALAAAGFPATVEGLANLLVAVGAGFWLRWRSERKLDRKVKQALEQHVAAGPVPDAAQGLRAKVRSMTRKSKKTNVKPS